MSISGKFITFLLFLLPIISGFYSCEREAFQQGEYGQCSFSTDTLIFDTIFTDIGTATYKIMVRNNNNYKIQLDSVYLAKKQNSDFKLNIDGEPSSFRKALTIDAHDSLYIFVQAYIHGSSVNQPFVTDDSVVVVSGSHISSVKLIAAGQNVVPFHNDRIQSQEWNNNKPYLIFGTLTVDSASTLTIGEGARIYFHKNARLLVNGNLIVNGTYQLPVTFTSDRPEKDYDSIPGQWGGIELRGAAQKHVINYASIRNGTLGILIGGYNNNKRVNVDISNTIIANMGYSALIAYQAGISATNCVMANCGNSVCSLLYGGTYEFLHCTLANYGARYVSREPGSKTLVVQDFVEFQNSSDETVTLSNNLEKAYFGNSIVYGNSTDEIKLSFKLDEPFHYTFENCMLRISDTYKPASNSNIIKCIVGKSPEFSNPVRENFKLDTISPAKDAGKIQIGTLVPLDIENNSRLNDTAPDMGAYERIEK